MSISKITGEDATENLVKSDLPPIFVKSAIISKPQEADKVRTTADKSDIETYLKNERNRIMSELVEETLKNTMADTDRLHWNQTTDEWKQYKEKLVTGIPSVNVMETSADSTPKRARTQQLGKPRKTILNDIQLAFAQQIQKFTDKLLNDNQDGTNLVALFKEAANSLNDTTMLDIWDQVAALLSIPLRKDEPLLKQRASLSFRQNLLGRSCDFLQKQFVKHMQMLVHGNLELARQGGVPGTIKLVQAYLNVRRLNFEYEDGRYENNHPLWAVAYYCYRAGDLRAAAEVLQSLKHTNPGLADFTSILKATLTRPDNRIAPDDETKMKLEYRRNVRTCKDPFKRIMYCLVGNCDPNAEHPKVTDKLEDWLWIRLVLARQNEGGDNPAHSSTSLFLLQKQIVVDFGEQYFLQSSECPLLYWSALWLTGQFESAIEILSRQDDYYRCLGLHIAMATHQSRLLLLPLDPASKLITSEKNDPPNIRRLNLARLIRKYTEPFESTNPQLALDYLYFLKSINDTDGVNLFAQDVGRVVLASKEYSVLLGTIGADGMRRPGFVDKYEFDTNQLLSFIANQCELTGTIDDAIHLYDLVGVLQLICGQLSTVISGTGGPGSNRDRISQMAYDIAVRYRKNGCAVKETQSTTFFLLLDLCTFFDMYHSNEYSEALDIIRRLRVVPDQIEQVPQYASTVATMAPQIQRLLPDVMLAVMTMLDHVHTQLTSQSLLSLHNATAQQSIEATRTGAQAIIQYAAMMPMRVPAAISSKLIHLESKMH